MNRALQPFNLFGLAVDLQDFTGFFWDEDFLDYYTAAGDPIFIGGTGTTVSKLSHGTVRAVAVANVAVLSGAPVLIDGVSLIASDILLLTAQTTASENGAYIVAAGAWPRDPDWGFPIGAATNAAPFLTRVTEGTVFADSLWVVPATLAPSDVIGVDALTVSQVTDDVFPVSDLPVPIDDKLLLSIQEAHGWGFIFLPFIGEGEFGFSYDEGPLLLLPDATFLGPAWDVGFFDGFPVAGNQAFASIVTTLNEIKLGGVGLTFIRSLELNALC
jgi:hypothetical protein